MIGKLVRVEFNTARWPVHFGTYTYEGHDEKGYWLRRKDGVQRFFEREDIVEITVVDEELPQEDY